MDQDINLPPSSPIASEPEPVQPSFFEKPVFQKYPFLKPLIWQGKIAPAFWTVSSLLSLTVNIVLIVVLILLGRQLFSLKSLLHNELVGGLYQNFELMDQAHIKTTITVNDTIQVKDTIPVVFNLPLSQNTEVVLTQDTPIQNATIFLNGASVPLNIILPKGTLLNIGLNLTVPVSQTIPVVLNVPVKLQVPVDIALNRTQLHEPFSGLKEVLAPYQDLLAGLPTSWNETPLCGPVPNLLCKWILGAR